MRKRQKLLPGLSDVTVLVLLARFALVLGQTTCNNGQGRVLYERLPNQQLQGFDDDVVRDSAPPFRVLEKCQDLCLRDRTASNNLGRACTSFDFQPGSRIASFSGSVEYEESTCYLTREQAAPEGIGNLMLVPNSVHFTEVCITSSRPDRECPSRRYVFERHPRKKLKLPVSDIKEVTAANRSDCEDKCLNEFSFVCRSANYDSTLRSCAMSRFTRRTHPELLEDDPNSDYLENTCLNAERRCDGLIVYVKEENKRLGGPFEVEIFNNMTLEECQSLCLRAEKYFCRSIEFDDQTKQCILSEEDSVSQKDDLSISSSPTHHFYDLVCLDNQRGAEYPDNSVTSHLFASGRRPDTAFQRYRNSRLGGEFHSEITGRSLSECLDECLRQTSFQCRSAVYSDRFRTCRLSRYNQRDGMRIIYDADYDYYENLMPHLVGGDTDTTNGRPDPTDWRPPYGGDRDRDRVPDDRIPPGRYPQGDRYPMGSRPEYGGEPFPGGYPPTDRYPGSTDRYPVGPGTDRYPSGGGDYDGRYPPVYDNRFPGDRYGPTDRYPGDRDPDPMYPGGPMRYPPPPPLPPPGSGYPSDSRYPPPMPMDSRYPMDRYPPSDSRYPSPDSRYPADARYPPTQPDAGGRYPPGPVPDSGRYPPPESGRYPPPDSGRYPPPVQRPDSRYPVMAPPATRYPPPQYMPHMYGSAVYPVVPSRAPPNRGYGPDPYPAPAGARPIDNNRYPPAPDARYPLEPVGAQGRYPTSPNVSPFHKYMTGPGRPSGKLPIRFFVPSAGYDPYMGGYEPQRGYVDDRYGGYYPSGGGRLPPPLPPPMPAFPDRDRGYRRPAVGMAPDGGGYPFEIPYGPSGTGYDNTLGGGDGFGGYGPQRPYETRCDNTDTFKQVAAKRKMRKQYIRRVINAPSLGICQQECAGARDFMCRSFNYRDSAPYETEGNCELSDRDSRDLEVPSTQMFESDSADYYERTPGRGGPHDECLDVGQVCNEDGMEFTLRTPEGFVGRIYAYGFYDRCFFRGNGGTVNVLRISGPQGYPECGTQRYGDTMTNIIVVQFSDNVQTGRDKRFNLTCMFRGPGEAVVTSGYIGAGSGSPIPIEYLPAENSMSNKVRLMILYQGRPTTTIAVGDPLTFRLESQDGYSHATDIFATNVVARDPYSGRSVQLIDNYGCPVDSLVFPELGRSRDNDALEARFNAFKIPESNFLVFEATVRTCRGGCQPAYCPGPSGRSEPSFGRRKRSLENGTETIGTAEPLVAANPDPADDEDDEVSIVNGTMVNENATSAKTRDASGDTITAEADTTSPTEMPEQVREMIEVFPGQGNNATHKFDGSSNNSKSRYFRPLQVFQSREEMQQDTVARKMVAPIESVCLTHAEYYGLISAVILLIILLISITFAAGIVYRSYWKVFIKNRTLDRSSPVNSFSPSALHNAGGSQFEASGRAHSTASRGGGAGTPHVRTPGVSLFGSGLQKTFATGNLSRMCQIPVMNPLSRTGAPKSEFDDPSEPIYTDPSLFERSRSLRSIAVDQTEDANNV
uniref:No mechanoreceptor potential A n=1 Tax=Anopheles coluzzii TaxID=1518534 RepID=A0A8W7P3G9_ANOCL